MGQPSSTNIESPVVWLLQHIFFVLLRTIYHSRRKTNSTVQAGPKAYFIPKAPEDQAAVQKSLLEQEFPFFAYDHCKIFFISLIHRLVAVDNSELSISTGMCRL